MERTAKIGKPKEVSRTDSGKAESQAARCSGTYRRCKPECWFDSSERGSGINKTYPKDRQRFVFLLIIYTPLRVRCFSVKVNGRQDDRYNANGDILLVGAGRKGGLSPSQQNFKKGISS